MLNIGLTGNIASGKSSVSALFAKWGATVIDADQIVHRVQQPGTAVFDAIVARFGPSVVAADGGLDRAILRAVVLKEPKLRAELETIVHPAVRIERDRLMAAAQARGDRIVVNDIPLLFETMDPTGFDAVVLVDAPAKTRRDRLMRTRALDATTANGLIAAQMPSEAKRARATFVIDNDRDPAELERRAREIWLRIEAMAESGSPT